MTSITQSMKPLPQRKGVTLRLEVDATLLRPDSSGQIPLDRLEVDLVPKAQLSPNAPTVKLALQDPEVPPGYVPESTVLLVPQELSQDPKKLTDYYISYLPKGSFSVTQAQLDQYGLEQQQQGARTALPAGHMAKMMESPKGLKMEAVRDQAGLLMGTLAASSAALSLTQGIGLPVSLGAPLALAAAPLQIFGSAGTLTHLANLEHQKTALLDQVTANNPGLDPLGLAVAVDPNTAQPVKTSEVLARLDLMQTSLKLKTVGAGLLGAAGLASLTAVSAPLLVPGLALASLSTGLADSLPAWDDLSRIRQRRSELEMSRQAGSTGATYHLPESSGPGQTLSFTIQQLPMSQAFADLDRQEKLAQLTLLQGAVATGGIVAIGLGCPIGLAIAGQVTLPLLARVAAFPKESWQEVKGLSSKWTAKKTQASGSAQVDQYMAYVCDRMRGKWLDTGHQLNLAVAAANAQFGCKAELSGGTLGWQSRLRREVEKQL